MTIQTSRRKFFGFMGGAAAAAPLAARDLTSVAQMGGALPAPPMIGGLSMASSTDQAWMREELKRMSKRLKEGVRRPDYDARQWQLIDARHIDSLRSVSQVNRARMYVEAAENRQIASETHWLKKSVADYAEKLGIPFAEWFA